MVRDWTQKSPNLACYILTTEDIYKIKVTSEFKKNKFFLNKK